MNKIKISALNIFVINLLEIIQKDNINPKLKTNIITIFPISPIYGFIIVNEIYDHVKNGKIESMKIIIFFRLIFNFTLIHVLYFNALSYSNYNNQ